MYGSFLFFLFYHNILAGAGSNTHRQIHALKNGNLYIILSEPNWMARNYKDLQIYHLSYDFTLQVYKITEKFPDFEHKNISQQIRRAVVSIPLNIAEGSSRRSNREFLQFLTYGFGSAKEVEVLLNLAKDLNYISEKKFNQMFENLNKVMAKMFLFMRDLEKRVPEKKFKFFQKLEKRQATP